MESPSGMILIGGSVAEAALDRRLIPMKIANGSMGLPLLVSVDTKNTCHQALLVD